MNLLDTIVNTMKELDAIIDNELNYTTIAYYRIVDDRNILVATCKTSEAANNYLYRFPHFDAVPVYINSIEHDAHDWT